MSAKEPLKVGYSPVIDVWIRSAKTPIIRIGIEVIAHIDVHQFLEVNSKCAIAPNNYVSANANFGRNITARIINSPIAAIVSDSVVCPVDCCVNESSNRDGVVCLCVQAGENDERGCESRDRCGEAASAAHC